MGIVGSIMIPVSGSILVAVAGGASALMVTMNETRKTTHVCPWWLMHVFDNPVRRIFQNPQRILDGIVIEGSQVLDLGCGMGYFTVPIARMVGENGVVYGVDLQEEMLAGVRRRAERAGVLERVRLHRSTPDAIGLSAAFDVILAHWMIHEVPDQKRLLTEIRSLLKESGRFLLVEPRLHVSGPAFRKTVLTALGAGLHQITEMRIGLSRGVLFSR